MLQIKKFCDFLFVSKHSLTSTSLFENWYSVYRVNSFQLIDSWAFLWILLLFRSTNVSYKLHGLCIFSCMNRKTLCKGISGWWVTKCGIVITYVSSGISRYPVFIWKYANTNQSCLAHLPDVQLNPSEWQLFHSHKQSDFIFFFHFFSFQFNQIGWKISIGLPKWIFPHLFHFLLSKCKYIEPISDK